MKRFAEVRHGPWIAAPLAPVRAAALEDQADIEGGHDTAAPRPV